jgi:protein TonB
MGPSRDRPHPRSPVQLDRPSKLPLLVLAGLAVFLVWKLRDTWVDALAPPAAESEASRVAPGDTSGGVLPARGNLAGLISGDDYPTDALRNEEQGKVTAKLSIDRRGHVSKCEIISSSGSASLDRATCSILARRARFTPARDVNGKPVPDTFTQSIVWQLR